MIDRIVDLLGEPRKVTAFRRHDTAHPDALADNTLAVLEFPRAMAEVYIAAQQPHGNDYRTFEILGVNGTFTVRPFHPYRFQVDLKKEAGPYRAGTQHLSLPLDTFPQFTPDFAELAAVIRQTRKPSFSPEHDLATHRALLQACGQRL